MARKLPKIISQEEFEKVLKVTKEKHHKLAFILGFEAGMRISEIAGLKDRVPRLEREMVDLEQHTIRIESGKGRKDRIVPLPKKVNYTATRLLPIVVSRRAIQKALEKYSIIALGRKINFHMLRHGFASHLVASGRPLHEVQMLLGHSRLDTTGIYLHANPKQAVEGARDVF